MNIRSYALHSFRISAATTATAAAAVGLLAWLNSNAYISYIHCTDSVLSVVPRMVADVEASNHATIMEY